MSLRYSRGDLRELYRIGARASGTSNFHCGALVLLACAVVVDISTGLGGSGECDAEQGSSTNKIHPCPLTARILLYLPVAPGSDFAYELGLCRLLWWVWPCSRRWPQGVKQLLSWQPRIHQPHNVSSPAQAPLTNTDRLNCLCASEPRLSRTAAADHRFRPSRQCPPVGRSSRRCIQPALARCKRDNLNRFGKSKQPGSLAATERQTTEPNISRARSCKPPETGEQAL